MLSDPFAPPSGSIPYALGMSSIVRIPIPGTNGLFIELRPRGRTPRGGSTSTLFFQDISGRRHLRLDYGYNAVTRTINYHWNQSGTHATFAISDHAPAGRLEASAYHAARHFRRAGRVFAVVGVGADLVSIVVANAPIRRASAVVGAWALAWAGCKTGGAGGAAAGTAMSPIGTAIGGVGGCIIGGYAGYRAGTAMGGVVFDLAQTTFTRVPELPAP